jgi:hypothetical protein
VGAGIVANAAASTNRAARLRATADALSNEAANAGQGNALAENVAQQGLVTGARQSQIQTQKGQQEVAQGQLSLKHADLVNELGTRLSQAKQGTPEYQQLMAAYRTLIGKEGSRYETKIVPGRTYFDPQNPTVPLKEADTVVTNDTYGNEGPHVLNLNQATVPSTPQYKEGQLYKDASGQTMRWSNGNWVKP